MGVGWRASTPTCLALAFRPAVAGLSGGWRRLATVLVHCGPERWPVALPGGRFGLRCGGLALAGGLRRALACPGARGVAGSRP